MKWVGALVLVLMVVLSGCQSDTIAAPPTRENLVQPIAPLDTDEQKKIVVELGFYL
jgi:hypothetical protein